MVMKPEVLVDAIEDLRQALPKARTILLSASGQKFTQERAIAFSKEEALIIVCGRYEGVDQRAIDLCIDEEISIGDFVVMGGEVPAMAVIESVCRLIPAVVGNSDSIDEESFSTSLNGQILLEWPHYTRPESFREMDVPEVLRSGDHKKIQEWRYGKALEKTKLHRPDLIKKD